MTPDDATTRSTQADLPAPTPGPDLKARREEMGIEQRHLAKRLGIHRTTLNGLEGKAEVKPIAAAQYMRALRELVAEAVQ